ncbi:hypothetical protein [Calidithermus chliarophilus]|uniref:hypothetical protein n=1 Tax=Calidithermus chliarophilus TaxID=52023 RepID=UPI00042691AF|nr:hypothetical protein [Calidithermus chliarophilus]
MEPEERPEDQLPAGGPERPVGQVYTWDDCRNPRLLLLRRDRPGGRATWRLADPRDGRTLAERTAPLDAASRARAELLEAARALVPGALLVVDEGLPGE